MYTQRTAAADCRSTAISDRMANAITAWYRLLYGEDVHDGYPASKTRAAIFITNFAATLATEELEINTGTGARADYVKQQVTRYVLPELHNNVQTAAAGGEVVLKPFIHNGRILCDAVTADRFYPTRINAAKEVEACYFTDFATYNGKDVVRVEFHDMRADGYYIHNEAYYDDRGTMKGNFNYHLIPELSLIHISSAVRTAAITPPNPPSPRAPPTIPPPGRPTAASYPRSCPIPPTRPRRKSFTTPTSTWNPPISTPRGTPCWRRWTIAARGWNTPA